MLHRPEVLLDKFGTKIIKELQTLKSENIVSKIGVSISSPDILKEIINLFDFDIVQAPFNVFDQRILSSGWADKLKENNVEIHTRSVFLQGLLLLQKQKLPMYFADNWPDLMSSWFGFLETHKTDAKTIALSFALRQPWIDKLVVGVDNVEQLKNLLKIEQSPPPLIFPKLECIDENLIDPSRWKLK